MAYSTQASRATQRGLVLIWPLNDRCLSVRTPAFFVFFFDFTPVFFFVPLFKKKKMALVNTSPGANTRGSLVWNSTSYVYTNSSKLSRVFSSRFEMGSASNVDLHMFGLSEKRRFTRIG